MLKVYETTYYYRLNNTGDWIKVGGTGELMEDRDGLPNEEIIFDSWSWQDVMDYLKVKNLCGFYLEKTLVRKIPYFTCSNVDSYYGPYDAFSQKDFETFTYKRVYTENKDASLWYIMKQFPAEKCIQYLKERGITTCPINSTK